MRESLTFSDLKGSVPTENMELALEISGICLGWQKKNALKRKFGGYRYVK
jgi:hypothetical protein